MMSNDDSQYRATDTVSMRRTDLVVEVLDGEAVLYDPVLGAVHRFDASTFQVWQACDGQRNIVDITCLLAQQRAIPYCDAREYVERVLEELRTRGLLSSGRSDDLASGQERRGTLSRRELLSGGATKLALAAPVISTFFATGAYASGPSASGAFGDAGCKTVGYSCSVQGDCCENNNDTDCEGGSCCFNPGEMGCTVDADCCQAKLCVSGTCAN